MTLALPHDLRLYVIRPALVQVGLWSPAAEDLVLGTAAVETAFAALDQQGRGGEQELGPGLGFWQMERSTHDDIMVNYLAGRHDLADKLRTLRAPWPEPWRQLVTNLSYGAAMCRVKYLRSPMALPAEGDVAGYSAIWLKVYNGGGAGTTQRFLDAWRTLVAPAALYRPEPGPALGTADPDAAGSGFPDH